MLYEQDKRENTGAINFEPNEGERTLLSCNKGGIRSPSLDLEEIITPEQEALLDELAQILAESIMWHAKHGNSK